jgi:16S rRNA (cytosine1402-N4)-methyltransferase
MTNSETAPGQALPHQPVLYHEIIHALDPHQGGVYIDATVGAGGHAWGILHASSPDGRLLGLDVDAQALALAKERLVEFADRLILVKASYTSLLDQLSRLGWETVDGIVFDLGISSMQVDAGERGFSFHHEAPLDMRFDQSQAVSAADLVNTLPESELADILYLYGEERRSRQVARAIVRARPLHTTTGLAAVIAQVTRSGKPGIHPATRTFQALRIAVNGELESIRTVLPLAITALAPGGKLAVISFHSLEDRIVKQFFRRESSDCLCPPKQPVCTCGHQATILEMTRRPVEAGEAEIKQNHRARSAKLRVAQKKYMA